MRWIIDGHQDLAYNAVVLGRNLRAPLAAIRRAEADPPAHGGGVATTCLPALRQSDVRVVLGTLYETPTRWEDHGLTAYATPEEAYTQAREQVAWYLAQDAAGEATLVRTRERLAAVLNGRAPRPGLVLLMEGADPLRTPADLAEFVAAGVRVLGPAWRATRYAGGAGESGPLTDLGRELLDEMARLGVVLDLSHLAVAAITEALQRFPGRIVASHANCRALVPGERQLADHHLRAVADRDGVIGLVFYNRFIRAGWQGAEGKTVTLDELMAHARHIKTLVGARCLALGTDLDGGLGRDDIPREIDSAADLPRVADTLTDAGFTPDEVDGVLHGNWLRVLQAVLPD